mgnify:FL=1
MNGKLFQVKDTKEFGVGLAMNSVGEYVLEMKNSGVIQAFSKDKIEIVMPYTLSIVWTGGEPVHYRVNPGKLQKNDVVLEVKYGHKIRIGVVAEVDTKRENATQTFKGMKVVTLSLSDEDEPVPNSCQLAAMNGV